ncbi:phosphoribosylamine--glycine ligase [Jannaschia sp. R86511]|uniref:phosphoribosylamine--glycine ligase n=1 Tax=Jannaschia sp. R86511 TaxID=3093853 RepID=UPI0036D32ACB
MRVVVVGSGAREHAIVRSLLAEDGVSAVVAAPGNPGMAAAGADCRYVGMQDPAGIAELAVAALADLVVVGPEVPLVAGAADAVRAAGIPCFGPSAAAARLEGSKAFAKEVMAAAGVPTARPFVCDDLDAVVAAVDELGAPYVVKDDGLAAGKGVVVTDDREAALAHAASCLDVPLGRVVVEEYLDGPEVSVFCLCDGDDVVALAPAQDFKRLRDGGQGPNTGGMGAYAPLTWLPEGFVDDVLDQVARPVLREMAGRGTPFTGVLYVGLALTGEGLRVVEFNVRLGDPEAQVVLARLGTPLGALLLAAAQGRLAEHVQATGGLQETGGAAVAVVVAAPGYPASPRTGDAVLGLTEADAVAGAHVLHAGTAERDGHLVTAGGRVLTVVGTGPDVAAARSTAYEAVEHVHVPGGQLRLDIAAEG